MDKKLVNEGKSIKEILGNIKTEIVSDDGDAVLELTELADAGREVEEDYSRKTMKVANVAIDNDVGQFLNLINKNEKNFPNESNKQDQTSSVFERELKDIAHNVSAAEAFKVKKNNSAAPTKQDQLLESLIHDALYPILNEWIEVNLPKIVSKIVEEKIDQIIKNI